MRYARRIMLFLIITAVWNYPVHAQNEDTGVMFDFSDVDIRSFIKIVSELTGKNYVVDPAVTGKITVTSPSPIPRDAVASVFESVLGVYGYAPVVDGELVKIVPAVRAKQEGYTVTGEPGGDVFGVETRVIQLDTADSTDMKTLLQPLLTRAGNIVAHPATRTLIITDTARNLDRLNTIITSVDSAGPETAVKIYKLQNARAGEIADALKTFYAGIQTGQFTRAVFVPEDRSNVILCSATADQHRDIARMIRKLDKPLPEARANIRVIRLKHSDAAAVATVLNAQLSTLMQARESKETPGTPVSETGITIGADTATNALIVAAPPDVFEVIESVISELDIPRQQILVEALVVEISTDRTRELGLEWRLTDPLSEDSYRVIGGANLPLDGDTGSMLQTAADPFNFPPGLVVGLVKGTISFNGQEFANIGMLARAMEGESGVNVLSTPHLLTLDNEEAEIIVGEERPFLKSSQTTDTGATVRTYEFKDTGLTMTLTPRITDDGQVQIKLFQEIKDFVAESDVGAVTSTKRQARTTIRIADGRIAVIGGLLKEDQVNRTTKIPCLGDIPYLGNLFRSKRSGRTKTNLLIFITPTIVKDAGDLDTLTERYRSRLPVPEKDPLEPAASTAD